MAKKVKQKLGFITRNFEYKSKDIVLFYTSLLYIYYIFITL